jgi:hypothetical protein
MLAQETYLNSVGFQDPEVVLLGKNYRERDFFAAEKKLFCSIVPPWSGPKAHQGVSLQAISR